MKNSQKGFAMPVILILVALLVIGGGAYVYMQNKQANQPATPSSPTQATSTMQTSVSQTADWKTYIDPDNRFSLEYPSTLTISSEKSSHNQVDTVRFLSSPSLASTVIQVGIFSTSSRWPDLKTLVNDQYLMSKGGNTPVPIFKVVSGGLKLQDVGLVAGSHLFVGQLNSSKFIVFSFKDENLVDKVLSSFKSFVATQTASGTPITLTTIDICSPLLKDASTLLFTDNNNKTWTVDYRNASFSEYSLTTGRVQGADGLLKTTLQDWLKSLYRVGQPRAEICGAPGKITVAGTLIGDTVFASHIELDGQ